MMDMLDYYIEYNYIVYDIKYGGYYLEWIVV